MNNCLIIPAGGSGKRFGDELPKQFHLLQGIPLIVRTIKAFEKIDSIKSVVIAVSDKFKDELYSMVNKYNVPKNISIVTGGAERQDSVYNALQDTLVRDSDFVLIHDAVRPFVTKETVEKLIAIAANTGGAIPAIIPKDTVREVLPTGDYRTHRRDRLRLIQTPQVFKTEMILKAYANAMKEKFYSTDDAAIFEHFGYEFLIVEGDENNIKITTKTDFVFAELTIGENK
jgi:2-C-methyl-D-erythritol 4-phosphate cytidylyltransferase